MRRGSAVLCALVALATLTGASSKPHESSRDVRFSASAEQSLKDIAEALRRPPATAPPDPGCSPGLENRQSDLCAQWKAADAAQDAANWTQRTFWLTLAASLIGAATLVAAWRAAVYAGSAAEESKRSADASIASQQSFVMAEDASLSITLVVGSMITSSEDGRVEYSVGISPLIWNVGRSSARIHSVTGYQDEPPLVRQIALAPGEHRRIDDKLFVSISENGVGQANLTVTYSSALSEKVEHSVRIVVLPVLNHTRAVSEIVSERIQRLPRQIEELRHEPNASRENPGSDH